MFSLIDATYLSWLYYALFMAYSITVIGIIIIVLSENRSPVKSLAWVTVLLLLPAFGIILYLVFGRSIKNTRMISRRNRRRLRKQDTNRKKIRISHLDLSQESKQLIRLTNTLAGSMFYTDNDCSVFTSGGEKFESLFRDISNAKRYVNLQYYIIEDDATGIKLKDLLERKSREGVLVRLIYDNVGSYKVKKSFFRDLQEAGVQVFPFFKVVFPPFGTRINWRNHRKICIIDGEIGYIGGMNIAERYITGGKFDSWRDTHLRITGPAVLSLQYSFAVDWNFMGQPLIDDEEPSTSYPHISQPTQVMQLLTSGPTSHWTTVAILFNRAIASAKKRVFIQTPYFLPTEGLLKALQAASLSGVDVRIMIPTVSDSKMLTSASSSYVTECLKSGMKIYTYDAGMLHAKTMLVDDEFVSIGSTNFDFRSFEHNFEANIQIYSKAFNAQMEEIFFKDMQSCTRIISTEWNKRPISKKVISSITRLLSPIL